MNLKMPVGLVVALVCLSTPINAAEPDTKSVINIRFVDGAVETGVEFAGIEGTEINYRTDKNKRDKTVTSVEMKYVKAIQTAKETLVITDNGATFERKTREHFSEIRSGELRSQSTSGGGKTTAPATAQSSRKEPPAPAFPGDEIRTYRTGKDLGLDMDAVYALKAMTPKELDAVRSFAIDQGLDWDHVPLTRKLPLVRKYLVVQYQAEVARFLKERKLEQKEAAEMLLKYVFKPFAEKYGQQLATETANELRARTK